MNALDVLDKFDLINTVQGWIWGLTSWLPHRRSHKGRKVGKTRIDGGTRTIRVDRSQTSGREAEDMLAAAHIPIAGRHISSTDAYFVVRARQAAWAELVLLRGGAVLSPNHQMIDPKNAQYAADKGAVPLWGQEPPAGQDERTQAADGGERWGSEKMSLGKSKRHSSTRTSGGRSSKSSRNSGIGRMFRRMW